MLIGSRDRGGWVELRLDRPAKRNALSHELVDQLIAALDDVAAAGHPLVVLGANGPVFCAGGDRSEIGVRPQVASSRLLDALRRVEVFVIARVEAPVLGAGVALVRSCPVALGTPAATFTLPEAAMGNYPVPAAYLAGVLPARRVVEVAALGAPVGSDEAVAAGLLTRVAAPDEIDDVVALWAERLTAQPAVAHQARRVWQRDLGLAHESAAWQEDMVRQDIAAQAASAAPAATAGTAAPEPSPTEAAR